MKTRLLTIILAICSLLFPNQLKAADVDVLIIGSIKDSGEMHPANIFNSGRKPAHVPNSTPFSPNAIGAQLQNILAQDGRGSVNVSVLDRYASDAIPGLSGWFAHSYNLSTWFHYPYPAGAETNRWANLRGEAGTQWDYIVLIEDPYTMEYTPGLFAHGVAKIAEEVAKSANPAQLILLMPWQGDGSSSSVNHYREVVYRTGRSGGHMVAPAALAWQACGSPTTNGSHPNAAGAYIAAASIYSSMYNQSAAASAYVSNDANANTTFNTFTNNDTAPQYTGNFAFQNPYLMVDDKRRDIHMSEQGTSTEDGFKGKIKTAMDRSKVTYSDGAYNDRYTSNTPDDDGAGWPTASPMPIALNYGRDGFYSEEDKKYVVNPAFWKIGFGYCYQLGSSSTTEGLNDIHIGLMEENDNDLANRMINEAPHARNLPVRTLWAQIHKDYPTLSPMRDTQHLSFNTDEAVGTYLYTLFSGRCPLDPKPAVDDVVWTSRKIGYETAWRVGRCQSRAPGFKVTPSLSTKTTLLVGATETMTVEFILPPKNNVTVNVSVSSPTAASLNTTSLVFTPANYNVPQQVVVTALAGSIAWEEFNVVFNTVSQDEACNQVSDSWGYIINRPTASTVTFDANNGTAPSPATKAVTSGSAYGTLATTSRAGFTFSGWYTAASGGSLVTSSTNVTASTNHTLYARWAENYTVSFDANGGVTSTPASKSVTAGLSYGTLATTSRVGFTFNGWFTAASGGSLVTTTTIVTATSNHSVFAQWTVAPTYTITYDGNGNTGGTVPSDQIKTHGLGLALATNTGSLTKTGFTFAGWNTAPNGSGTQYAAGAIYTADAALTLYARWNNPPVVNAGSDQTVFLTVGSPWSPNQLTPQLWLDADDTPTVVLNGATVSQWSDKSGNNRHATAAGTAQPTATSAGLNGKRILTFDGASDAFSVNLDFLEAVSHSAFIVTKPTTFNNIYGAATGNQGANSLHVGFSGNNYRMNYWANDYGPARSANFVSGSANIVNYVWTSGISKQILANGKSEGTNASAGVIGKVSTAGGGRIGTAVGQGFFGGDIAEIIMITGAVSASDREKMEGYLAHKWGLAGNLVIGHPHKSGTPGGDSATAILDGTSTDPDPLIYTWTVVSGPSSVSFGSAAAIDTNASFSVAGVYTLRLTANDGVAQVSDDVVITVNVPSPFTTWSGSFPALTNPSPSLDFDGGSLPTGIEWVVGGSPSIGSDDTALAPTINTTTDSNGKLLFSYRRTTLAKNDPNTTIAAQYGNSLTGWTNAVHQGSAANQITITATPSGPGLETVTVALPLGLAGGDKLFVRLYVAVAAE